MCLLAAAERVSSIAWLVRIQPSCPVEMSDRVAVLQAEQCPECQAYYVRSCASFECLPVVEIFLEEGITDSEVRASAVSFHNVSKARSL